MNFKTKRIIILILDIFIAIFVGCTFYRINDIQNIDNKYAVILLVLIVARIVFDFIIETVEEASYKLDQEIILLKKQHEIDRLKTLNQKEMQALSTGNTQDFKEFESLLGK